MLVAGVIEVIAGILAALEPRIAAPIVGRVASPFVIWAWHSSSIDRAPMNNSRWGYDSCKNLQLADNEKSYLVTYLLAL
jgi:hypothetical protein